MTEKQKLIEKLILVCGKIDARDIEPSDPEPEHCYEKAQTKAVKMLTMKQLNKLIKEYEKQLSAWH